MYSIGKKQGFVTLIAALSVSAVLSVLAVSVLIRGTESGAASRAHEIGARAHLYATACVELALQEIRDKTSYSGSGSETFSSGSCTFTVIDTGGQNRTIEARGESAAAVQRVRVTISSITPEIAVETWERVASF